MKHLISTVFYFSDENSGSTQNFITEYKMPCIETEAILSQPELMLFNFCNRIQEKERDERSSPSGQSDQTSEGKFDRKSRRRISTQGRFNKNGSGRYAPRTVPTTATTTTASSSCSDEQLRCWEYMLEQNTQLLFDKELDTLTNNSRSSPLRRGGNYTNYIIFFRPLNYKNMMELLKYHRKVCKNCQQ